MSLKVSTERSLLKDRIKTPDGKLVAHKLICCGLDETAKMQSHWIWKAANIFPEVKLEELRRPEEAELLIGHREGRLSPQRRSPLWKTVGRAHLELLEDVELMAHESKTCFARSMRTVAVKCEEIFTDQWEVNNYHKPWISLMVEVGKHCGGCHCGNCQPKRRIDLCKRRHSPKFSTLGCKVSMDSRSLLTPQQ